MFLAIFLIVPMAISSTSRKVYHGTSLEAAQSIVALSDQWPRLDGFQPGISGNQDALTGRPLLLGQCVTNHCLKKYTIVETYAAEDAGKAQRVSRNHGVVIEMILHHGGRFYTADRNRGEASGQWMRSFDTCYLPPGITANPEWGVKDGNLFPTILLSSSGYFP